jgi:hypothetical protein
MKLDEDLAIAYICQETTRQPNCDWNHNVSLSGTQVKWEHVSASTS